MPPKKDTPNTIPASVNPTAPVAVPSMQRPMGMGRGQGRPQGGRGERRPGGRGPARERVRPEFDQKIITIRRVARVAAGGRRFNFSVALVAGDRKGSVGVGLGKAGDTALAIEKAMRSAKKNMIRVALTKSSSINHVVRAKYSSARIFMMPAPGRGIVAGSAVRNVIDLAGIKDVTSKILSGSKNKLNIARAAIKALSQLKRAKVQAQAEAKELPKQEAKNTKS